MMIRKFLLTVFYGCYRPKRVNLRDPSNGGSSPCPKLHVRVDTPPHGYSSPRKLRRPNWASSPPIVLMTKRSAPAAAPEARTPPYTGGRKQHYRVPTDDNHCAESGDPYNSVSAYGISLRLPPLLKNLGKPRVSRPTTEAHDLRCPLPYSDISSLRIVANM